MNQRLAWVCWTALLTVFIVIGIYLGYYVRGFWLTADMTIDIIMGFAILIALSDLIDKKFNPVVNESKEEKLQKQKDWYSAK